MGWTGRASVPNGFRGASKQEELELVPHELICNLGNALRAAF